MLEQDAPRFAILITKLSKVYIKPFAPDVIDVYWNALKDFSFEDVEGAVDCYIKSPGGMYIPKPADIIMLIKNSPQNQASKAWDKAFSAVRRHGSYTSVAFDDALIHVVIKDMGGWREFCSAPNDRLLFTAKEFQERYRDYVAKSPPCHPKYFVGAVGGRIELIGNEEKVMQVIETGRNEANSKQLSVDVSKITSKAVSK